MALERYEYKIMSTETNIRMPVFNYMGLDGKIGGGAYTVLYNIGGPADGYIKFPLNVSDPGKYNMLIDYMSGDGKKGIKIDINGVNTGTVYVLPRTFGSSDPATYTIPLDLEETENIITLHGDGKNLAPHIVGVAVIIPGSLMKPIGIYNVAKGILTNGAIVNEKTGFVTKLGGINKGMSTFDNINSPETEKYMLSIKYLDVNEEDSQLKITVNNTNLGPFTLPKTEDDTVENASVFTLPVDLKMGSLNKIVFSGNGTIPAPDLELFTFTTMPPPTPPGTYSVAGRLEGGATFGTGMLKGYVTNIGGELDGATTAIFKVKVEGLYIISLTYKNSGVKEQSLMIDVNEEKGTVPYLLKNAYPSVISFVVPLKEEINKLRFYGENKEPAPSLAYFSLYPVTASIPEFDTATGILKNKAMKDEATNFIKDIGGRNMGRVSVDIGQVEKGRYNLVINYLSGDADRSFRVKVNNFDTGMVYNTSKTTDFDSDNALTFTLPIEVNSINKNTIEFLGNGINPAPYLGKFKLISTAPVAMAGTYNVASGILENGAVMATKDLASFTVNLGGAENGSSTVTVKSTTTGNYNLLLQYKNIFAISLPLAIDVNDSKIDDYLLPPNVNGKVTIPVALNSGANTIKFYGDGTNPVPYLSTFSLRKK
ncbi:hypothetical protein [Clostridium tarantellae]|uniref:CBM6 domain-containing protein n=1 Tax=Clostridium tarantellae TaxID=39493 RepID=A0A6I1MMZ8_9CLOT|nr:hypothetical protein [Clostridium tarantellae]MPQ44143.1 hypothetical protein [Clostridium tarantellae]